MTAMTAFFCFAELDSVHFPGEDVPSPAEPKECLAPASDAPGALPPSELAKPKEPLLEDNSLSTSRALRGHFAGGTKDKTRVFLIRKMPGEGRAGTG